MPATKGRRRGQGKRIRYSKAKKMVTGHGPTMLERIAQGAGSVAKLATAVAPVIAAINTEEKYSDKTAAVASHSPGSGDQIIALTDQISQSLTDVGRIGNSVLAKNLQVRLAHNFTASTTVLGLHCRMMLVCWKENAAQNIISAAKLFESPSNLYSPVNKDYSDQFVVLKDKFFTLNATNGVVTTASQGFQQMKVFKPINWHIRWSDAPGSAATQNHIYLILRSSGPGTTNGLQTTYYSRITYTDN